MTVAQRLMVDCFRCSPAALDDPAGAEAALVRAAGAAGWNVTATATERFHPVGITAVLLAREGRMSLHTWPEHGYCNIEVLHYQGTAPGGLVAAVAGAMGAEGSLEAHIPHGTSIEAPANSQPQSRWQHLLVAESGDQCRLYSDGELQFSSYDEYRYHEALVHPAMILTARPRRVLVLGGGDGLAVREILKHGSVERVVLVDIDPAVTAMAANHDTLARLNGAALKDARVQVCNEDAFDYVQRGDEAFDVIIIDFPEPVNPSLSRLYALEFVGWIRQRMAAGGVIGAHATSPTWAPVTYWSIIRTARSAGLWVRPYHVDVPTFGDWGFYVAAAAPLRPGRMRMPDRLPTRYLTTASVRALFQFGKDAAPARRRARRVTLGSPVDAICRRELDQ